VTKIPRPDRIRLEASTFCQLKCPSCPTATHAIDSTLGKGFLKLRDFKKLLNENPWVKEIELSNYGEIFLNPELLGIFQHAFEMGVLLTADVGVNLNFVKDNVLEGLVKYRIRKLKCSIDGASNVTYTKYRVGGNFDVVMSNIRKINELKEDYGSEYPHLIWQFVIFGHNEHELELAKKKARENNMSFDAKLSWDNEISPVRDLEMVREEAGASSRKEYFEINRQDYMQEICHQLWDMPQINWDGKNLGCCQNFWGDFGGNAFTNGLEACLNSEKMNYARDMLSGLQESRDDIPCTTCSIYLGMKNERRWLDRKQGSWNFFHWIRKGS